MSTSAAVEQPGITRFSFVPGRWVVRGEGQLDLHARGIPKIDLHFASHRDVADTVSNTLSLESLTQLVQSLTGKGDMVNSGTFQAAPGRRASNLYQMHQW
jgi:hypothetical protein